jgi:hypothetical protein
LKVKTVRRRGLIDEEVGHWFPIGGSPHPDFGGGKGNKTARVSSLWFDESEGRVESCIYIAAGDLGF